MANEEYMTELRIPGKGGDDDLPEIRRDDDDVDIDVSAESDVEIEIEDDTPEQDRGRKPLDRDVADPSDDEIEQYSDKVQKRIKELAHARHDERRAKETALREREEAIRVAQQLVNENKQLRGYVNSGEQTFAEVLKSKAEADLEMARKRYKEAAESYDTDAMLAAQEELQDAKIRLDKANNFRPTSLQVDQEQVYSQPSPQPEVRPDDKTLRWQAKNQWFGAPGYEEVTAMALATHQRLTAENGADYARTDEYYERIDSRLREKFPEIFGEPAKPQGASTSKRPAATVVASAARSTATKKIKLTRSQEAIAAKLGLTPKQYAVELMKMEARNG
jgi:hypothetical protein